MHVRNVANIVNMAAAHVVVILHITLKIFVSRKQCAIITKERAFEKVCFAAKRQGKNKPINKSRNRTVYNIAEAVSSSTSLDSEAVFAIDNNESKPPITRMIQVNGQPI